ncbi:hypothetical protein CC86DRAFT_398992 [Ophiobolus disseminans]|uniref:BTB domain-containing protein n=1 Tax=Ophiobolus disseminans TaxID=1469910 RepID=A0A6A6ZFW6_9PLEO|nr:hypothetical protein CC86DRAFT_398992 [Ophiobolus disseminans]
MTLVLLLTEPYRFLRLDDQNSDLDTDVVEGELSESKEFVQVLVGRHGEMRTFLKKDLWNRPYFRDARTGIMYFFLTEEGIWQLRHPQLININIDDFQFVAEFLTDEAFGIRYPEDQEQNKEAVAQCVSAWEAAEKLGLDDMLAHIAKKVHFLQWDNADVLTWAITLYRTSGLVLEVHQELKDWVAGFLAHHYWAYIKDDTIGDIFRKRLRVLPELEKDVTVKRAELLTTGAKFDEEEESDEDAMVDGDDL